jgi:uncharacterized protein (DUF433 family)
MSKLVGMGVYTFAEAGRLLRVRPSKIARWLRGHRVKGQEYQPLWTPDVSLEDGRIFLSFRDLMEVRVADAFIRAGVSAIKVRAAINLARLEIGQDHPLATNRFRTDGREIFLSVIETDEQGLERERLLNLFRQQFEFKSIIEPILRTIDFGVDGNPLLWWPEGRRMNVVVDPARAFGQPIDAASSVPTAILAAAAKRQSIREAARAYEVSEASIRRAVEYEATLELQAAA